MTGKSISPAMGPAAMELPRCGLCGKAVRSGIAVCPNCGNHLEVRSDEPVRANPSKETRSQFHTEAWCQLGLAALGGSLVALLVWGMPGSALVNPYPRVLMFYFATAFALAACVVQDAAQDSMLKERAAYWFLFMVLAWPLGFPAYLKQRAIRGYEGYPRSARVLCMLVMGGMLVAATWSGMRYSRHPLRFVPNPSSETLILKRQPAKAPR